MRQFLQPFRLFTLNQAFEGAMQTNDQIILFEFILSMQLEGYCLNYMYL